MPRYIVIPDLDIELDADSPEQAKRKVDQWLEDHEPEWKKLNVDITCYDNTFRVQQKDEDDEEHEEIG